jgi:transposase
MELPVMNKSIVSKANWKAVRFMGIDLGDKRSRFCALDSEGNVVVRGAIDTSREHFSTLLPHCCRVAIEVGTHSPWISRALEAAGHEVYVANPRKVRLIFAGGNKSDRLDAENLARLVRLDPRLLYPVHHRGEQAQVDLTLLKARDALVEMRTKLINTVRGLCKSLGVRLPSCAATSFAKKTWPVVPKHVQPNVGGLFSTLHDLNKRIREYDNKVNELSRCRYPETGKLQQVAGVGPLTALAFVLTLDDPRRFSRSRQVGAWVGLTCKRDQSGELDKQLGITRQGNEFLRRLLVSCAHYILGPFGPDCELRRYGERIASSGGPSAKKRAVVAVARKLAVLLHKLWVSGQDYVPLGYQPQWGVKDAA